MKGSSLKLHQIGETCTLILLSLPLISLLSVLEPDITSAVKDKECIYCFIHLEQ